MIERSLALLWQMSLLFSVISLLILPLRWLMLRRFGAGLAYASWLLLPVALVAALLPRPQAALTLATLLHPPALLEAVAPDGLVARDSAWLAPATLGVWLGGMGIHALLMALHQRCFSQALVDGRAGPALVGLWRPRIHMPQDFEQRFSAAERHLVLAHEQVHRRRRDNLWNLLALLLCNLQWFNPLAWLAWHRMRADQELACDAAVLRGRPEALADYARALLKTQGADGPHRPHLLSSHWQSRHPLVERVTMLKQHARPSKRSALGRRLLITMGLLCATAVYALQPGVAANPPEQTGYTKIKLAFKLQVDGKNLGSPVLIGHLGHAMGLAVADDGKGSHGWALTVTTTQWDDTRLKLEGQLRYGADAALISSPVLIVAAGQPTRVEVTTPDGAHLIRVDVIASLIRTDEIGGATPAATVKPQP